MKVRELIYLLGIKPKMRRYGHRLDTFELVPGDRIQFANWLHPAAKRKSIEAAQVAALSEFLRPGDSAIDVGAYIGDTAVPMALAAGASGCVFAFEPNPSAFAVLQVNAALNPDTTRIVPLPFAAGETEGRLIFKYSDPDLCNGGELRGLSRWRHAHAFEVEVASIHAETLLREDYPEEIQRLRYIKIDSEGADFRILKSMDGLIREFRPYLRCEIYRHLGKEERLDLFRFLLERDYRVHRFLSPIRYRGPELSLEDACKEDHYDIFAVPAEEG